jgi:ribosomal protein S18 acetylase RimI-like enzyme
VRPDDAAAVREITAASGFFSPAEVEVAVDLVGERLAAGAASGYEFVFAEAADERGDPVVLAYACFGPIPLTASSWDLYWIAVRPQRRRAGLGRAVLREAERTVAAAGGSRIYVDTSSRPQYEPTRAFYRAAGYTEAARLPDFYAPGDGKVVFSKVLAWTAPPRR